MACLPTCIKPIIGTMVTRNQSHPTTRYLRRQFTATTAVMASRTSEAASTCQRLEEVPG